jgi:hypothetical protein
VAKKYSFLGLNSRSLFPRPRKMTLQDALGEDLGFSLKRKRRRRRKAAATLKKLIKEA